MKLSEIKNELKNILETLKESKRKINDDEKKETEENLVTPVILNDKIDKFINWYEKNGPKEYSSKEIRDFIEKMAVWYELRYPNYKIDIPKLTKVNNIVYKNNESDFLNFKTFINLLGLDHYYLNKPRYISRVSLTKYASLDLYFNLSKKGVITNCKGIKKILPDMNDKDIIGMNIKDLVSLLNEKDVKIPLDSEMTKAIQKYDNSIYQKEEMLNCVMYKILARGKDKIGYQRALLFSQEFKRNPHLISPNLSLKEIDDKINNYIKWYTQNVVKGRYTSIGEYKEPLAMQNFIEKMAIWYELRYPDYEIDKIKENDVIENLDSSLQENNLNNLEWSSFFDLKAFQNLLGKDAYFLTEPKYNNEVSLNNSCHFNLANNGDIIKSQGINKLLPNIQDEDIIGMNIKDLVKFLKDNDLNIPLDSEVLKAIKNYDTWISQKEEMLNCVMYRIIERGGNRTGGRRALLFAKEFDRNIDIPMIYGIDTSDPYLRYFINDYLKSGGSLNLTCYSNYFSRESKYQKLALTTIQEELLYKDYTEEEKELHQRLVNALARHINQDELKREEKQIQKEEIENLRLQRKLEKSKRSF